MRGALMLALWALTSHGQPQFSRDEPKSGVIAYRDGRLLLGRDVDVPGTAAVRLAVEDREGRTSREIALQPRSGTWQRFRMTTAGLTADGEVVAGGVATESARRMENVVVLAGEQQPAATGGFSCWVIAAAKRASAWCLGYSLEAGSGAEQPRHLFYKVDAEGKAKPFYPLPMAAGQRTPEGLSRFPALGLPSLWANTNGSVWAWLPGDRKLVRFGEQSGKLEAWDVPVPKGGTAGVSVTVTSAGRVIALLPISQDGLRVAPGPSPVFGMFELNTESRQWLRLPAIPEFKRGMKILGSDAASVLLSNPETKRLEWYAVQ